MNAVLSWMPLDLARDLGWTLVHFLWQGAIPALLLALILPTCRSAVVRHNLALGALVTMTIAPVATFLFMHSDTPGALPPQASAPVTTELTTVGVVPDMVARTVPGIEWLVFLWFAGVALLSLRLAGGWWLVEGLRRRDSRPLPTELLQRCRALQQRLALTQPVQFALSQRINVPMVIGWFRPVVLLPVAALTGIPPQQLDALILHELAHIRRLDAFTNVFLMMVETVLFYHPAVWWVSARIRAEREHCCDDVAVTACGDATLYVEALTSLETHKAAHAYALAATGGKLKARVARLLGYAAAPVRFSLGAVVTLALLCVIVGCVAVAQSASQASPPIVTPTNPGEGLRLTQTGPRLVRVGGAETLVVKGTIENIGAVKRDLPGLLLQVINANREVVQESKGTASVSSLEPGGRADFELRLASPDMNMRNMIVIWDLPPVAPLRAAQALPIILMIGSDGVFWNGDRVASTQDLAERLTDAAARTPQPALRIQPSAKTQYQYVQQVTSLAQQSGLQRIQPRGGPDKSAFFYDLPEIVGSTKTSPEQFAVTLTLELSADDPQSIREAESSIVANLTDYLRQRPLQPNDTQNVESLSRLGQELRERANASSRSTAVNAVLFKKLLFGAPPPATVAPDKKSELAPSVQTATRVAVGEGDSRRVSIALTESMPVRDILIELARKARMDIRMDQRVAGGGIVMTANDRPFMEVVDRICDLAKLRCSLANNTLSVELLAATEPAAPGKKSEITPTAPTTIAARLRTLVAGVAGPEISIAADGVVAWNGVVVPSTQDLDERFKQVAAQTPQPEVHIQGAKDVRYEYFGRVVTMAQFNGIHRLVFRTTSSPAASAVKLDMPRPGRPIPPAPPEIVKLGIDFDGTVTWNGNVVANVEQLTNYFRAAAAHPNPPEFHVLPNPLVNYDYVVRVFAMAHQSGVNKIGFVGNDRFLKDLR